MGRRWPMWPFKGTNGAPTVALDTSYVKGTDNGSVRLGQHDLTRPLRYPSGFCSRRASHGIPSPSGSIPYGSSSGPPKVIKTALASCQVSNSSQKRGFFGGRWSSRGVGIGLCRSLDGTAVEVGNSRTPSGVDVNVGDLSPHPTPMPTNPTTSSIRQNRVMVTFYQCHVPSIKRNAGWPTGGDPYGHGVLVVVRGRESRPHGEGGQVVSTEYNREVLRACESFAGWENVG